MLGTRFRGNVQFIRAGPGMLARFAPQLLPATTHGAPSVPGGPLCSTPVLGQARAELHPLRALEPVVAPGPNESFTRTQGGHLRRGQLPEGGVYLANVFEPER